MSETAIHEIRLWERPFWKPARGKGSVLFYLILIHLLAIIGVVLFALPGLKVLGVALLLAAFGGLGTTVCYHRTQKITVQPAQTLQLTVKLEKDLRFQYPSVTSEVKLKVEPDRAAVFVDGAFVGHVHQFGGVGRAMLVAPGKHQIKIALVGYRDFTTEVNLQPNQKFTLKTTLVAGSVEQADPAVKKD
jgi:hypothetical protein